MTSENVTSPESVPGENSHASLLEDIAYAIDLSVSALNNRDVTANGQEALELYTLALEDIATAAAVSNATGLWELCNHLKMQVQDLRRQNRDLSTENISFLAQWPEYLVTYLADPSDLSSCETLVRYLQDSSWPIPLASEEADTLLILLHYRVNVASHSDTQETDSKEPVMEDVSPSTQLPESAFPNDEPLGEQLVTDGEALLADDMPPVALAPESVTPSDEPVIEQLQIVNEVQLRLLRNELSEARVEMDSLLSSASAAELSAEERSESLEYYAVQLERLGMAAEANGLPILKTFLTVTQHRVNGIVQSVLSPQQHYNLELLPGAIHAYLSAPNDPSTAEGLMDLLRGDTWPSALEPAYEMTLLRALSCVDMAIAAGEMDHQAIPREDAPSSEQTPETAQVTDEPITAEPQMIAESMLKLLTKELAEIRVEMENLLSSAAAPELTAEERAESLEYYAVQLERLGMAAEASGLPILKTFLAIMQQRVNGIVPSGVSPQQHYTLELIPGAIHAYLCAPNDPSTAEGLMDLLRGETWPSALEPAYETTLLRALSLVEVVSASLETECQATSMEDASPLEQMSESASPADEPITAQPQVVGESMLKLLMNELGDTHDEMERLLSSSVAPELTPEQRAESIEYYAVQLERLGMAAEAIGLPILKAFMTALQHRVTGIMQNGMSPQQQVILALLPGSIHAYLSAPTDPSTAEGLMDILRGGNWPIPLQTDYATTLSRALSMVEVSNDAEVSKSRQVQAQPEDILLTIPGDLSRELLEGLLQELPVHTSEFSTAIQNIASGNGTFTDIDIAKRAAHTLKGAANTVGIKGIANLTHHVEDILVALSNHGALPNRALAEMLTQAGDCLEAMGEAVLGTGPEPDDALTVLQEVLDWANRIDREGLPSDDATVAQPAAESASREEHGETTPANAPSQIHNEAMVRVPAALIDELLRLMGETIISTGQVRERSRRLVERNKSVQQQNRVFLQLATELEDLVELRGSADEIGLARKDDEFDPLEFEHYSELHTISRRLIEAATDSGELTGEVENELSDLNELIEVQNRLHALSQNTVMRTRMVPVFTVISRLQRSVRQTARLLDKHVALNVTGADTMIDSNILNELIDPLMHILRNAVDHGIETPEMRRAAGKSSEGRIDLLFLREGNQVVVRCRDDGAGLDLAAVRRTAEEKGVLTAGKNPTDEELARLILAPGFSTRSESTQVSGRGIGMDVVHSRVLQLKGGLNLHCSPGKGLEIELRLPATLIATHALIVRAQGRIFAISSYGVQDIHYVTADQIQELGDEHFFRLGETIYPLAYLDNLLHLSIERRNRERHDGFPVLLVRLDSGVIHAVRVSEIIDSRELVVKGLGRYVPKPQGVVGATILGDGSVAAVIDVPELMRKPVRMTASDPQHEGSSNRNEAHASHAHMTALVVDDSLSARRATAQFMKDAGFEVRTAIDGLEAVSILDKWKPDILLVDMEMPRMNGLELTAHVRAREGTANIPVIMITSRSTEKHRSQAAAAGVNVYLTKPFGDEELLQHINELTAA